MRFFALVIFSSLALAYQAPNSWKLSTADTAVVIAVEGGRPVLKQLSSPGANQNWLPAGSPEILMPSVVRQGATVQTAWKFLGGAMDAATGELTLRFSNADPALELHSIWRARPGHGPVEHWLTIANNSGAPVTVSNQDSLVLGGLLLPATAAAEAWWINRGGGNANTEGGTLTERVNDDFDQVITSDPTEGSEPSALDGDPDRPLARPVCRLGIFRHWPHPCSHRIERLPQVGSARRLCSGVQDRSPGG